MGTNLDCDDESLLSQAEQSFARGDALAGADKYEEALKAFELARQLYARVPDTDGPQAECWLKSGAMQRNLGEYDQALAAYDEALQLLVALPDSTARQAQCWMSMGVAYRHVGQHAEALAAYRKSLAMFSKVPGTELEQARCWLNMSSAHHHAQDPRNALTAGNTALSILATLPDTSKTQARCWMNVGNAYRDLDDHTEAIKAYERALEMLQRIPESRSIRARCLTSLGLTYEGEGKAEHGFAAYVEALRLFDALGSDANPNDVARLRFRLSVALHQRGSTLEALSHVLWAALTIDRIRFSLTGKDRRAAWSRVTRNYLNTAIKFAHEIQNAVLVTELVTRARLSGRLNLAGLSGDDRVSSTALDLLLTESSPTPSRQHSRGPALVAAASVALDSTHDHSTLAPPPQVQLSLSHHIPALLSELSHMDICYIQASTTIQL